MVKTKKKNPQDATLRNTRSLNKRVTVLEDYFKRLKKLLKEAGIKL